MGAAVIGLIATAPAAFFVGRSSPIDFSAEIALVLAATTIVTGREMIVLVLLGGALVWLMRTPPAWLARVIAGDFVSGALLAAGVAEAAGSLGARLSLLAQLLAFFSFAGAFVFGSGLAIVPFLHGGVVLDHRWLTEQQFRDAVAVALITPGPVVITTAFIGFLVAGAAGGVARRSGPFCRATS